MQAVFVTAALILPVEVDPLTTNANGDTWLIASVR